MTAPRTPAEIQAGFDHLLRIWGPPAPPRPISDDEQRAIDADESRGEAMRDEALWGHVSEGEARVRQAAYDNWVEREAS